jgi:hypothetical protein
VIFRQNRQQRTRGSEEVRTRKAGIGEFVGEKGRRPWDIVVTKVYKV